MYIYILRMVAALISTSPKDGDRKCRDFLEIAIGTSGSPSVLRREHSDFVTP